MMAKKPPYFAIQSAAKERPLLIGSLTTRRSALRLVADIERDSQTDTTSQHTQAEFPRDVVKASFEIEEFFTK